MSVYEQSRVNRDRFSPVGAEQDLRYKEIMKRLTGSCDECTNEQHDAMVCNVRGTQSAQLAGYDNDYLKTKFATSDILPRLPNLWRDTLHVHAVSFGRTERTSVRRHTTWY